MHVKGLATLMYMYGLETGNPGFRVLWGIFVK